MTIEINKRSLPNKRIALGKKRKLMIVGRLSLVWAPSKKGPGC